MMIPVERLRDMTDLGSMSDAQITALEDTALAYIEQHTGRALFFDTRTETHEVRRKILLTAYPVESVSTVALDGAPVTDYSIDKELGIVTLNAPGGYVTIAYTGGYEPDVLPSPIICACALLISALKSAGDNIGQQVTYMALDGYQVTYASKTAAEGSIEQLSPVAAALLRPYMARRLMR